ncbi:hypothetical protein [Nonomuraea soli]|uniref:Exo-alpha-sialidase n=1 Tax=Nonomuraea soli TaxID=1032476 RepID=A0A7W0HRN3_9ACTN|nr:hypothetical protein [Nonomuraea soli]MBA2892856.1 hypothetical protein [Nonomuraea soli]
MRRRVIALLSCVLVGCTSQPAPPPPPSPAAATLEEIPLSLRWERVTGLPGDDAWERGLHDITAAGPGAAWAVGYTGWEDGVTATLRRWDGTRWHALPAGQAGSFHGIDSDGPANVWAVGGDKDAMHWDGRAWRRIKTPIRPRDVAGDGPRAIVISAADVATWDGTRFTTVLDQDDNTVALTAVDAGAGHAWVTGSASGRPALWHGRDGSFARQPLPDLLEGELTGVWQNGGDDVWAVGTAGRAPLALHWDGRAWTPAQLPGGTAEPVGVTATGPREVWIAATDDAYPNHVVILHGDGGTWTRELTPSPGEVTRARITSVPGTSQLWLAVSVVNGDSESIVTLRRR